MRVWRRKNPAYFKYDETKGSDWLQMQRRRSKQWRDKNPDKVRSYRQAHSQEYRAYMRDYMRQYRQRRSGASPPSSTPNPDRPQNT